MLNLLHKWFICGIVPLEFLSHISVANIVCIGEVGHSQFLITTNTLAVTLTTSVSKTAILDREMSLMVEQSLAEYEAEVLAELDREILQYHPVLSMLKLVRFVSYSNGKGRPKRRPREITLVVRRKSGRATSWEVMKLDQIHDWLDGNFHNWTNGEILEALLGGEYAPE